MPLFTLVPRETGSGLRTNQPVSMWSYTAAAFICSTSLVGTLVLAKARWGIASPAIFGFVDACISTALAVYLFFAINRRPLFPVERRWLVLGCFLAFWFYDVFLRTALMIIHGTETLPETLSEIGGTIVDFALVWGIVHGLAFLGAKRYRVLGTVPPPNNRWRGP